MSPSPERRGAALLRLLCAGAGITAGHLVAGDVPGRHTTVATLDPGCAAAVGTLTTRRLSDDRGLDVGVLHLRTCPGGAAAGTTAAVVELLPHFAAVAAVVSRRLRLGLTGREGDILSLIAEGLTNAQIAQRECVSVRTVTTHVEAIFRKLRVTNRVQAARIALDCAMVAEPPQRFGFAAAHGLAAS
ncbi:MAG: LuxR family two component transcriptional regulator [Mycobacterium sp.]|jgi:DNA-binding CsgD family transcriptional regulator|nr:LuxR family two component transcriptional regulator [Mycobacterium sp.]